jgi:hypothetical protein
MNPVRIVLIYQSVDQNRFIPALVGYPWGCGESVPTIMRHLIAEAGLRNVELIENFQGDMPFVYCARDFTVIPYARLKCSTYIHYGRVV